MLTPMQCANHPAMAGIKRCTTCKRSWCAACVKITVVGQTSLESCALCHSPLVAAADIVAPLTPINENWSEFLMRPFRKEALITAAAIAFPRWLGQMLVLLPLAFFMAPFARLLSAISFAATCAYYFQTITHIHRGNDGMPEPNTEDGFNIFGSSFRGSLCFFVGLAPFLYWFWFVFRPSGEWSWSTAIGLLAIGQLFMPAAIISVVLSDSSFGAVWPPGWIQIIVRAPGQYLALVGLYLIALLVGIGAKSILDPIAASVPQIVLLAGLRAKFIVAPIAVFVPIVGLLIVQAVANVLLFTQAALVGGFLRRNSLDFD